MVFFYTIKNSIRLIFFLTFTLLLGCQNHLKNNDLNSSLTIPNTIISDHKLQLRHSSTNTKNIKKNVIDKSKNRKITYESLEEKLDDEYTSLSNNFNSFKKQKKILQRLEKKEKITEKKTLLILEDFLQKDINQIRKIIGKEDFIRSEGNFLIFQYIKEKCIIDFFIYEVENPGYIVHMLDYRHKILNKKIEKSDCEKSIVKENEKKL